MSADRQTVARLDDGPWDDVRSIMLRALGIVQREPTRDDYVLAGPSHASS